MLGSPKAVWKVPDWGQSGSGFWSSTSALKREVPKPGQKMKGCRTLHQTFNFDQALMSLQQGFTRSDRIFAVDSGTLDTSVLAWLSPV